MTRSRRHASGPSSSSGSDSGQQPVERAGAGGYNYRLHADGRVEIVRSNGSIFVSRDSNATAYDAIIAEVGAYPGGVTTEESASDTPYLDGVAEDTSTEEPFVAPDTELSRSTAPQGGLSADSEVEAPAQEEDSPGFFDRLFSLFGGESDKKQEEPKVAEKEPVEVNGTNVHAMNREQLALILNSPKTYGMSVWAAAHARDRLLEHQQAVDSTGVGTIEGVHTENKTEGAEREDCTTFILETLGAAFASAGQGGLWNSVRSTASKTSGADGFKGIELMKALQAQAGWKSVFWAPDTQKSADDSAEHTFASAVAKRKGTYYGVDVDRDKSVTNYRRTEGGETDTSGLESLKKVPVAVLAARGGTHMALMINGVVYEVHWTAEATDRNAVEATPLESWGWLSGMVTAPAADIDRAFAE